MKKCYILLLMLLLSANITTKAQIANGQDAPDFVATDINGVEHHLYDYLAEGKTVVLNFFVSFWNLCWDYHTTGTLQEAWELYGPNGTDELVIFQIEVDPDSELDDIINSPLGNWLDGVDYFTINDIEEFNNPNPDFYETVIANLFQVTYVPMIYYICPSHVLFEDSYLTPYYNVDEIMHHSHTYCHLATEQIDAALYRYIGEKSYCDGKLENPNVVIYNYSIQGNLTKATIQTLVNGEVVNEFDYVGDLPIYECDTVALPTLVNLPDNADISFKIVADGDTEPNNDEFSPIITNALSVPTDVLVEVQPDGYFTEFSFMMLDDNDNVLFTFDNLEGNDLQTIPVTLPENTCIKWMLFDEYGDGMPGGYVRLLNPENNEELVYIIGKSIGSEKKVLLTTSNYVDIAENEINTLVYPNPANDQVVINGNINNVKVYNAMGQLVVVTDQNHIDVSGFANGIYLFNVTLKNGMSKTERIVVE